MPHIHELYDFTVSVFIVHDNKVLLVHHPRYDKWLPIGGHIELDEDVEMALYREVKEETGLEVEVLSDKPTLQVPGIKFMPTPRYLDAHNAQPPHKHIAIVYFARAHGNQPKLSSEHSELRWLDEADLAKPAYNLDGSIQFYCRQAIKAANER